MRGKQPKLKPNQAKHLLELHDSGIAPETNWPNSSASADRRCTEPPSGFDPSHQNRSGLHTSRESSGVNPAPAGRPGLMSSTASPTPRLTNPARQSSTLSTAASISLEETSIKLPFEPAGCRLPGLCTQGAQPEAAWETTPTTVLIGERDTFSEADRRWADEHLDDVRVIDTDHFIIFRYPEVVAQLVLEGLRPTT